MGYVRVRLLLDSHCLLWWDRELDRLSQEQRDAISDRVNEVFVSAATVWELGIKAKRGKLVLPEPISEQTARWGFVELPITFAHAEYAASLPLLHGDPFDRMLVAQARVEGMTLVTADAAIREYGVRCL